MLLASLRVHTGAIGRRFKRPQYRDRRVVWRLYRHPRAAHRLAAGSLNWMMEGMMVVVHSLVMETLEALTTRSLC